MINEIEKNILQILDSQKSCSVMLTGGRSAASLYSKWSHTLANYSSRISFYFGDERCVHPESEESNFYCVKNSLFTGICGLGSTRIYRILAECSNVDAEANRYSLLLPKSIDVLLLSLGEDGHIASLFPHSHALLETEKKVVPVIAPKAPYQRLTITPAVIQAAQMVFVLAFGDKKRRKYEEALADPEDTASIPARLVLDRIWIFDLD